jgi:hypothetical protein
MSGLFAAQGQMIAADEELNGVTQGRPANGPDHSAVAQPHLQETAAKVAIASNGDDGSGGTVGQLSQSAGARRRRRCRPACLARPIHVLSVVGATHASRSTIAARGPIATK